MSYDIHLHTVDGRNPAPLGNRKVTMKHCKQWGYKRINHIPTGAGFLPSTVSLDDSKS